MLANVYQSVSKMLAKRFFRTFFSVERYRSAESLRYCRSQKWCEMSIQDRLRYNRKLSLQKNIYVETVKVSLFAYAKAHLCFEHIHLHAHFVRVGEKHLQCGITAEDGSHRHEL